MAPRTLRRTPHLQHIPAHMEADTMTDLAQTLRAIVAERDDYKRQLDELRAIVDAAPTTPTPRPKPKPKPQTPTPTPNKEIIYIKTIIIIIIYLIFISLYFILLNLVNFSKTILFLI